MYDSLDTDKMWKDSRIRGLREEIERRTGAAYAFLGVMVASSVVLVAAMLFYVIGQYEWTYGVAGTAFAFMLGSVGTIIGLNWKITDLEIMLMEEKMK